MTFTAEMMMRFTPSIAVALCVLFAAAVGIGAKDAPHNSELRLPGSSDSLHRAMDGRSVVIHGSPLGYGSASSDGGIGNVSHRGFPVRVETTLSGPPLKGDIKVDFVVQTASRDPAGREVVTTVGWEYVYVLDGEVQPDGHYWAKKILIATDDNIKRVEQHKAETE